MIDWAESEERRPLQWRNDANSQSLRSRTIASGAGLDL
jgi:hypothetical protein